MKSPLLLAAAAALVATASCSKKAPEASSESVPVIGVSVPAADHGWTAGVGYWAEKTIADNPEGVNWVYQKAADAKTQSDQVEAMLAKGIDTLVILPSDSDSLLPVLRKAKDQGVYIVTVDRGLSDRSADVYVAGDNKAFGRKSLEFIADKLGGKGKIVILEGIPCTVNTERVDGAKEVLAKYPEIEVLGSQPANWNRQEAYKVMQAYLVKFDHIDAVWAADDDMALGVEQAIRESGRGDEMFIMGGAGMKEIVKKVLDKDPLYPADTSYPPSMIAAGIHLGLAAALYGGDETAVAENIPAHLGVRADQLAKEPAADGAQRDVVLDVQLITPENAADFYFPDSAF